MEMRSCPFIHERSAADVLVLPFWKQDGVAVAAFKDSAELELTNPIIDLGDFKAKEAETTIIYSPDRLEPRVLLLGLGDRQRCTQESLRRCFAEVVKALHAKKWTTVNVVEPMDLCMDEATAVYTILEALMLTNYSFDYRRQQEKKPLIQSATLITQTALFEQIKNQASAVAQSVNYAKDLVNGNADEITPKKLADEALALDKNYSKIHAKIFDRSQFEKMGMGLFAAVARCSAQEPYFIVLEYKGALSKEEKIALIGKGITYDTGGLSLKTSSGMETMKCDMAGAAAVMGTIKAIADLEMPVNVVGLIPATENSIGALSYKLGDVYTSYCKKSVEITNTDAEGRLALADSISYALEEIKPSRIIDLATLTGAAGVALGDVRSPLFSNHEQLASELYAAGEKTGERMWQMPLDEDYKEMLQSKIADIKNYSGREGSLVFSALFLQEFAKTTPWAHLDIAYTAYLAKPRHYHTTLATGYGVRLLVEYLRRHHAS